MVLREKDSPQIGGYNVTPEIEAKWEEAPDVIARDPFDGRELRVVFGLRREAGDPAHSVFCRIVREREGVTSRKVIVVGGITRDAAIEGLGVYEANLVRRALQQTSPST